MRCIIYMYRILQKNLILGVAENLIKLKLIWFIFIFELEWNFDN